MQSELENITALTIPDLQAVAYSLECAGKTALKSDLNSMHHLKSIIEKVILKKEIALAYRLSISV